MNVTHDTWRTLGLCVAGGYFTLGAAGILFPRRAAYNLLGANPDPLTRPRPIPDPPQCAAELEFQRRADVIPVLMPLLGARDVSIGLAITLLLRAGMDRAAGVAILAGLVLCAADIGVVAARRGTGPALFFAAGALVWAVIGYVLYEQR